MSNWLVEVARYPAEGESGAGYVVVAYREEREHRNSWEGGKAPLGLNIYRLDDGRELRFAGRGAFEIAETGEMIWKVE